MRCHARMLVSVSREQARVGGHRSIRGGSAWTLQLAVPFMQLPGSRRAIQRLWKDGCQLDRLCCERLTCWGVVPVDGGAVAALVAATKATLRRARSAWLRTIHSSRSPNRF